MISMYCDTGDDVSLMSLRVIDHECV